MLQKIPTIPNHGYALFKILGFRSTPNFDVPRLCCWCLRRFFQFTVRALNLGLRNLICTKKIFMSFSFVPFPSYNRVLLRHLRIKTVSCIMKTMSVEMNNWFQWSACSTVQHDDTAFPAAHAILLYQCTVFQKYSLQSDSCSSIQRIFLDQTKLSCCSQKNRVFESLKKMNKRNI